MRQPQVGYGDRHGFRDGDKRRLSMITAYRHLPCLAAGIHSGQGSISRSSRPCNLSLAACSQHDDMPFLCDDSRTEWDAAHSTIQALAALTVALQYLSSSVVVWRAALKHGCLAVCLSRLSFASASVNLGMHLAWCMRQGPPCTCFCVRYDVA